MTPVPFSGEAKPILLDFWKPVPSVQKAGWKVSAYRLILIRIEDT
jgi:hypothetical protein